MMIQFIFTACFFLALATTWKRARGNAISVSEASLWSLLWVAGIGVVWWPGFASFLANKVGIGRGADLIIYSSTALIFWLLFRIFVRLEALERQVSAVTRASALHVFDKELKGDK